MPWQRAAAPQRLAKLHCMNKRAIVDEGCFAIITAVGMWHIWRGWMSTYDRDTALATAGSVSVVASHLSAAGPGPETTRPKDSVGSLWVRRSPKEAERRAWRKRLERRYLRLGASQQFIDHMIAGDMVGALNNLKKQTLAGDPAAIRVYGDFTYWNCFLHGGQGWPDIYATTQMQESRTLPDGDAEWFRNAVAEYVVVEKEVAAACKEAVNVGQVFDLVDESAKQGDPTNLYLSSMTANTISEEQQRLQAAAIAGSADAQFEIAFRVLGGHQKELLGTGPDALPAVRQTPVGYPKRGFVDY